MDDSKNLILAIVLSMAILFGWQAFFTEPEDVAVQTENTLEDPATTQDTLEGETDSLETPNQEILNEDPLAGDPMSAGQEFSADPVLIDSDRLQGSISPVGVRFNDLVLKDYYNQVNQEGGNVVLFRPEDETHAYFADFNWRSSPGVELPGENTVWQTNGETLTRETPVEFTWTNAQGVTFRQIISVDENFLFTIRQVVTNNSNGSIQIAPVGQVTRYETPDTLGFFILHEGPIGYLSGDLFDRSDDLTYKDLKELWEDEPNPQNKRYQVDAFYGWLGYVDKYWAATMVPNQGTPFKARYTYETENGRDKYVVKYLSDQGISLAPGQTTESLTYLFAGAKEVSLVDVYESSYNIPSFDLVVDWGWFYFLTKPIFHGLEFIKDYVGNVGVAILILTVFIKLFLFPLANKSYRSMSRMRKLQPKMQQLRERFSDDKLRLQQETMALYKKEKVNPASGCLPIIIQIPVFFALYKVLFVTIEMRQQPFFGWIHDLSAPDPLTLITGFGLFQWDYHSIPLISIFAIGIWPILMGLTMYLQQKLNPQSPDPIQAKIFMFMPIIFTFILAPFPAGLVIYWTWNNLLSIGQQWVIMKKEGAFDGDAK